MTFYCKIFHHNCFFDRFDKKCEKKRIQIPFHNDRKSAQNFWATENCFYYDSSVTAFWLGGPLSHEDRLIQTKTAEVLIQSDANKQWHSIAYYNYKFKNLEINWNTHNQKMYAIIFEFKTWWHYLQNNKHSVCVIINYKNLHSFMITKELNGKQMRWTEKLTAFDFHIKYRKDKLNPADKSSKKSDIMKSELNKKNVSILFIL